MVIREYSSMCSTPFQCPFVGRNCILPAKFTFHTNSRTIRVIPFVPLSSLIISIHIRILEALLKSFLQTFICFRHLDCFKDFYTTFIVQLDMIHYMHSSFSYVVRSKQTSLHSSQEKTSSIMSGFLHLCFKAQVILNILRLYYRIIIYLYPTDIIP